MKSSWFCRLKSSFLYCELKKFPWQKSEKYTDMHLTFCLLYQNFPEVMLCCDLFPESLVLSFFCPSTFLIVLIAPTCCVLPCLTCSDTPVPLGLLLYCCLSKLLSEGMFVSLHSCRSLPLTTCTYWITKLLFKHSGLSFMSCNGVPLKWFWHCILAKPGLHRIFHLALQGLTIFRQEEQVSAFRREAAKTAWMVALIHHLDLCDYQP